MRLPLYLTKEEAAYLADHVRCSMDDTRPLSLKVRALYAHFGEQEAVEAAQRVIAARDRSRNAP